MCVCVLLVTVCVCVCAGGRVVNSWRSDCTHLVMNTLTVTIKVDPLRAR